MSNNGKYVNSDAAGGNQVYGYENMGVFNQDGNANPIPQQQQHAQVERDWLHGMCDCSNTGACCESYWCHCCQVSRQCNMLANNSPNIHWPLLAGIILIDACATCYLGSVGATCHVRGLARKRYGIKGNECGDFCASCCCTCCVTQQTLREMAVMGDFPGATCCCDADEGVTPNAERME